MLSSGEESDHNDVQANIVDKLEELNQWQLTQRELLDKRQSEQRTLFGLDSKNMFEMLEILYTDEQPQSQEIDEQKIENAIHFSDDINRLEAGNFTEIHVDNTQMPQGANEILKSKPKRSFLKRGEGLKQRFKIDPDSLRLNNLPKYKFANAHTNLNKSKIKTQKRSVSPKRVTKTSLDSIQPTEVLDAQEKRFQQLLLCSTNAFSSTPDTKSFGSLPISLQAISSKIQEKTAITSKDNIKTTNECNHADALVTWSKVLDSQQIKPIPVHEMRSQMPVPTIVDDDSLSIFEILEYKAKQGHVDLHSSSITKILQRKRGEKNKQVEDDLGNIPVQPYLMSKGFQPNMDDLHSLDDDSDVDEVEDDEDDDNTKQANCIEENYGSDACNDIKAQSDPISVPVVVSKPQMRVTFADEQNDPSNSDQEKDDSSKNLTIGINNTTLTESEKVYNRFKNALFSALRDAEKRVLSQSDISTDVEKLKDTSLINNSGTSVCGSTNDHEVEEGSMAASSIDNRIPSRSVSPEKKENSASHESNELKIKTKLIKERLIELENEIATFKKNNMELIAEKQKHELEKAHFTEQSIEALERLNDEKIQYEIYLHDERMKIEEEKEKFKQQIKMQSATGNSKLKKDITALQQKVDELQLQLKQKEQNHVLAQSRLRGQLRQLEKDKKQLLEDIENLSKENKKLQMQNTLLNREHNNKKMLQEINRNLAKLTPKLSQVTENTLHSTTSVKKSVKAKGSKGLASKSHSSLTSTHHFRSKCKSKSRPSSSSSLSEQENSNEGKKISSYDNDDNAHLCVNVNSDNEKEVVSDICRKLNRNTDEFLSTDKSLKNQVSSVSTNDFKREIINDDGSKDILYPNGNLKKVSADGMIIRMLYFNKDIKETNVNAGTVKYYYAETNTWHTTYLGGLQILEFPNGQTEHRHINGIVEVHFADNTIKIIDPNDKYKSEEWRFANGSNLIQMRNGDKIITLPNGQKEIHTSINKRREYPDGTVKIVYPDGSQETRYSNGRVRLKDKDGNLVMDSKDI